MPRNHSKYPPRLMPSAERTKLWKLAAKELGLPIQGQTAYVTRWRKFWQKALDELRDQATWVDRDVRLLEEYVEWVRKADFHHRVAASEPYTRHAESGRTFAHPGWKLEEAALREAREVAAKLLLGELDPEDPDADFDAPPPT